MSKSVPEEAGGPVLRRDLKSYESLMNVIRSRRSIRRFDPKPVPEEDLVRILETGRWAPSGANIQPWAFIVVEESDRRRAIAELLKRNAICGEKIRASRHTTVDFIWTFPCF